MRAEIYGHEVFLAFADALSTIPEGHVHRVTTPENLGKSRGAAQNPTESHRTLGETLAEASKYPFERQISSVSLGPRGGLCPLAGVGALKGGSFSIVFPGGCRGVRGSSKYWNLWFQNFISWFPWFS